MLLGGQRTLQELAEMTAILEDTVGMVDTVRLVYVGSEHLERIRKR
jgi:hypothetical protein